jgi:hypothetical protein
MCLLLSEYCLAACEDEPNAVAVDTAMDVEVLQHKHTDEEAEAVVDEIYDACICPD